MFMRGPPYNYRPVLLLTTYCRSYFGVTMFLTGTLNGIGELGEIFVSGIITWPARIYHLLAINR